MAFLGHGHAVSGERRSSDRGLTWVPAEPAPSPSGLLRPDVALERSLSGAFASSPPVLPEHHLEQIAATHRSDSRLG
jgi:hypothetical protein